MKKFNISIDNKVKEFIIKNKYSEVTINEYLQIIDVLQSNELEEIDKIVGIVSILSSLDVDIIQSIPITDFQILAKEILFINNPIDKIKLLDTYQINGVHYVVTYNFQKLNVQQYIDLQYLINKDITENIHKLLSLFFIPAKEKKTIYGKRYVALKYGKYDIEQVSNDLLNHLTIDIANSLTLFFYQQTKILIDHTQRYLIYQLKKLMKQNKIDKKLQTKLINIIQSGGGLDQLTALQTELKELGIKFGK
jgi:hypothetical protein